MSVLHPQKDDQYDLTDFEDQLEEVQEPVFKHKPAIKVQRQPKEIEEVKKIAKSKGIGYNVIIREWIPGKVHVS